MKPAGGGGKGACPRSFATACHTQTHTPRATDSRFQRAQGVEHYVAFLDKFLQYAPEERISAADALADDLFRREPRACRPEAYV